MSASNRDRAIAKTLVYEGGYTNDPHDPGGATNWGITIFDARMYWKKDASPADVRAMPKEVAIEIYRQKYWAKMNCDADPDGVDFVTFDYGVNSGVGRAVPCRARTKTADPVVWVKAICASRLSFLHALRTWQYFGKGWGRRVADVEVTGVKMALDAKNVPAPEQKKHLDGEGADAAKKAQKNAAGAAGSATAPAATAPAAKVAPAAKAAILSPLVFKLIIAGVCVVAVVAVAYFVWHWWHNRNRAVAYTAAAKAI